MHSNDDTVSSSHNSLFDMLSAVDKLFAIKRATLNIDVYATTKGLNNIHIALFK